MKRMATPADVGNAVACFDQLVQPSPVGLVRQPTCVLYLLRISFPGDRLVDSMKIEAPDQ